MIYTQENFTTLPNVSAETVTLLSTYDGLLQQWQKAVNLISPKTIDTLWHRHFADSVGLYNAIPPQVDTVADMGSGGGFPALICGIMAKTNGRKMPITLIESDTKKSLFLRECIRVMELDCVVINKRIEHCTGDEYGLITARALAPLCDLLQMAEILKGKRCLFLKGERWAEELETARTVWAIDSTAIPSLTEEKSKILDIKNYTRIGI